MILFSFVVAPAAFAVLPEARLAGNLVSRVLLIVEIFGLILGITTLLILIMCRERRSKALLFESRSYLIELSVLILMLTTTVVSHFVVSNRLGDLRESYGEQISTLAQSDPIRLAFAQYHQFSVWLMSFNIIAALVLIVMIILRSESSNRNG
ncbi:MAG: DUF4149 domain-containing protein [Acidobacteria bacterium]|nr:DUF4149 domain-containing protein [Acidobacteriota bacterium]